MFFFFFVRSLDFCYFFFFSSRRRHTRWPRDWSSDVCSSDLHLPLRDAARDLLRTVFGSLSSVEDVTTQSGSSFERSGRRAMIKHLLKLIWNRKRINFLITVEIFISFIVLFVVILFAVYYGDNYRRPLGFDYEHVWNVTIEASAESEAAKTIELLMQTVKEFDEVESAATGGVTPYGNSSWTSGVGDRGNQIMFQVNTVSDDYNRVMGLTITRGRWFGKEDDGAQYRPLVIT